MSHQVIVVGASGFVGREVVRRLEARGVEVTSVSAPRLRTGRRDAEGLASEAQASGAVADLSAVFRGADAVVNAAGDPDASSLDEDGLVGANGLLPGVVAVAASRAGVGRLVHVSSAVVQNDAAVLDESEDMSPFSPYSTSKVLGERVVRSLASDQLAVVRFRPPSVHAAGRRVTRMIARIASSAAASVATPGDQPTPQAQLVNVADAVAHLACCGDTPPDVVIHPSEGVTVTSLMTDLSGGRRPRRVPAPIARGFVRAAKRAGRLHQPTAANARRIELLWLGQRQATSWLTTHGWTPVVGPEGWKELGRASRAG